MIKMKINLVRCLIFLTGLQLCHATMRKCQEGRYMDDVAEKCLLCAPLCDKSGQTYHTECPDKCPDVYAQMEAKDKPENPPSGSRTNVVKGDQKGPPMPPQQQHKKDVVQEADDNLGTAAETDNSREGGANVVPVTSMVAALVSFSIVFIVIFGVVMLVVLRRRHKSNDDHVEGSTQTPVGSTPRGSVNEIELKTFSPQTLQFDPESQRPLLPDGQSQNFPMSSDDSRNTTPKTVANSEYPSLPSMAIPEPTGLTMGEPSVQGRQGYRSCDGKVITQPQDHDDLATHPTIDDCRLLRKKRNCLNPAGRESVV